MAAVLPTIEDTRHARLLLLLQDYPTIQQFADRIERSHSQVSQWKNRSTRPGGRQASIDSDSARRIEQLVGRPHGWMDQPVPAGGPHIAREPAPAYLPSVEQAVELLAALAAASMPDDIRDDLADALAKLVRRQGSPRERQAVLALIDAARGKRLAVGT